MNSRIFGTTLSERPCYSRSYFATTPTRQKLTIHMDEPNMQGGKIGGTTTQVVPTV